MDFSSKIQIRIKSLPSEIIDYIATYIGDIILYSFMNEIQIYTLEIYIIEIKTNMIILNFYTNKKLMRELMKNLYNPRNCNKWDNWGY